MITAEKWWEIFMNYNKSLFPLQIIVSIIAFLLVLLVIYKNSAKVNILLKIFFTICNLFIGSMFFIILGSELPSPLRFIQGGLFITIGLVFLIDIFINKTYFSIPKNKIQKNLFFILLALVFSYPVWGILRGHNYTQLVYVGTLPCATTALCLLMLTASLPKANKLLIVLLLIWAIPFAPLIQIPVFKVYEDIIMFILGLYSLGNLIYNLIKIKKSKEN